MDSISGNGLTFKEDDLQKARCIIGLLNHGKFGLGSKDILEAAQALAWFFELTKQIEANIMEVKRVIKNAVRSR